MTFWKNIKNLQMKGILINNIFENINISKV